MLKILQLFIVLLFLSSCGQLTRFESGKTVGKNNMELSAQATCFVSSEGDILPMAQASLEYGVLEKIDVGLSISNSLSALVNAKFQLIGNQESKFALSINPALELQVDPFIGPYWKQHIYLPMSLEIDEKRTLLFEPRYIHSIQELLQAPGLSTGLEMKMDNDWKMVVGGSIFLSTPNSPSYQRDVFQLGVAFKKLVRR